MDRYREPLFLCYTAPMSEIFKRVREDFMCEHCDKEVAGNGYTNHCPACLWSKHVDVYPGDRAAECQGLMEPIGVEAQSGNYALTHRCVRCGYEQRNKVAREDDPAAVFSLTGQPSRAKRR